MTLTDADLAAMRDDTDIDIRTVRGICTDVDGFPGWIEPTLAVVVLRMLDALDAERAVRREAVAFLGAMVDRLSDRKVGAVLDYAVRGGDDPAAGNDWLREAAAAIRALVELDGAA